MLINKLVNTALCYDQQTFLLHFSILLNLEYQNKRTK